MNQSELLQIESFVVCPNCKQPYMPASLLQKKGAVCEHNYCGNCGFPIWRAFCGMPCREGVEPPANAEELKNYFPLVF